MTALLSGSSIAQSGEHTGTEAALPPGTNGSRRRFMSISPNHVAAGVVAVPSPPRHGHSSTGQMTRGMELAAQLSGDLQERLALGARLLQAVHLELDRAEQVLAKMEARRRELEARDS